MNLVFFVKYGCHCAYTKENSTMAIKELHQDKMFISNKNHFILQFFLASHCARSFELIYKINEHVFRL